ncbi:hypothetical protein B0H16DRAFT_1876559 [Mycena metata]|uniref:Uncharacterized protein n=1 Tax=Mycena metata TaxID=1033252 RepID=A0AAD7KIW9_9AGAR|nr:hypothetical protein B0H16DRAFT_1876559 [Mycena metata]
MAHLNFAPEPFEESLGNRATDAKASPDELKAFYRDMERGDLERKLSKRRSNSIWSRKSLKRTTSNQSQQTASAPAPGPSLTSPSKTSLARRASRSIIEHDRGESADTVPPVPVSRSIIPDRMKELPSWYRDNTPAMRYAMHNPVGPKWYRNHHLIPPANARSLGRPPSVFSPSFPPMPSAGSGIDRSEESSRMPNLSRSSSNSPAPTPSSSQTQVEHVPRSRKNSQTAHDNVDLLDGSDPWGNPWHHESPYDVGLSSSPVPFEENGHAAPQNPNNVPRSRTSSVTTAQNRRKTVTPSPLSQSTSAIHLQIPDGAGNRNGNARRLSKRRTVGIFGGRQASSSPNSPVKEPNSRGTSPALLGPPPSFISVTDKKDKRSSVFGRIAKRFSISRKPTVVASMEVTRQPSPVKRQPSPVKRQPSPEKRQPSPEKQLGLGVEPIKRVPPPTLHQESSSSAVVTPPPETPPQVEADRASSISLEAETPYTMGRLTVANPDPGSVESTPVQREVPLPVEKREKAAEHERGATDDTLSAGPPEPQIVIQRTQSPVVHSPSEVNSSRTSVPNPRPPSENVEVQSTRRAPSSAPPPAPEKPSNSASNGQRPNSSSAAPRTSGEYSSSPPTASASRGRTQSPPVGHLLDKPQPPPPQPSPKLPAVPFPADAVTPTELAYRLPEMTADISPLSTSSMLVHPPTPYTKEMLMPDEPEAPPPVPSKRSSRDPSPSQVSVTGRETETFRLVRSASGTVYASSETIRAAGEQWEVVESSNSKGKNRSQDRDRDSESRKEQRRQAKAEKEADHEHQRVRSERSRKRQSTAEAGASSSQTFPQSEGRHRSPIPEMLVSRQEEPKASRSKRDDDRERKAERKSVQVDPTLDKPQPAPPPPIPPRSRSREQASKSARPTSEVPTAADMNMMKAREAWDMDRLWKARSLSGMEPTGVATAPAPPPPPVPNGKPTQSLPAVYGSSHTAFMVSTPFQQQPPAPIYHSMPSAPPPVIYPAGYASPNGSSNSSTNANRASTSDLSATSKPISPLLANPLPEPPRESPYEPAPLKLPDYWGKHTAGVTTAH